MIYGLKNINLAALDSVHLTYILAMAENEQLLKQTIDQTQRQWFNTSTVRPDIQPESILQVSPNPFSDHLHIKWNSTSTEEKAEVTITDIIGRILLDRTIQSNQLDLKGFNLPAGSYTLIIRQGNIIYRSQIIREP
jgi:hypothetical protein